MRGATAAAGRAAALVLAVGAADAQAQAVGGRVVDSASRRPLPGVSIRLVRLAPADTAALPADTTPVARSSTARDGVFMLAAPDTGRYRVRVGDGLVGPLLTLSSADAFSQAEYRVSSPAGRVLFDFQVERRASLRPGTLALRYPAELQEQGMPGRVLVQFVVDTNGRAEAGSFRVLEATHAAFTQVAQTAVLNARYSPAEAAGRRVRQLVQLPLSFTIAAGPASGASRRSPALSPFGMP